MQACRLHSKKRKGDASIQLFMCNTRKEAQHAQFVILSEAKDLVIETLDY